MPSLREYFSGPRYAAERAQVDAEIETLVRAQRGADEAAAALVEKAKSSCCGDGGQSRSAEDQAADTAGGTVTVRRLTRCTDGQASRRRRRIPVWWQEWCMCSLEKDGRGREQCSGELELPCCVDKSEMFYMHCSACH